MKFIFDFDDVLFNNTTQFKEHMFRLIAEAGVPEDKAKEYYLEVREQEFSLRKFIATLFSRYGVTAEVDQVYEMIMKESSKFLNTALLEEVKKLGLNNCYIVTNGEQEFNKDKIKYSGIGDLFHQDHIYIVPGTKKEVIKKICDKNKGEEVAFIDDKPKFIKDINLKDCPNLKTILYKGQTFSELMKEVGTKKDLILELKRMA